MAARYGKIANLADFVRKAQMMNYEGYRAMYEGRNANSSTRHGVITWMSDPAQPSFVWQIYHYDLEANSSLFAVGLRGEMQHIQFNESNGQLQVINNLPEPLNNAVAHVTVYNLDGTVATSTKRSHGRALRATNLGVIEFPARSSSRPLPQA